MNRQSLTNLQIANVRRLVDVYAAVKDNKQRDAIHSALLQQFVFCYRCFLFELEGGRLPSNSQYGTATELNQQLASAGVSEFAYAELEQLEQRGWLQELLTATDPKSVFERLPERTISARSNFNNLIQSTESKGFIASKSVPELIEQLIEKLTELVAQVRSLNQEW